MMIERDGRLFVEGAMTMNQAASLLSEGEKLCAAADSVIDLKEVTVADSSALAVLIGWVRHAQAMGRHIKVANPPQSMLSLASLYGVDEMLAAFWANSENKVADAGS